MDFLFVLQLVDMPTIMETWKTIDSKNFYKTADVCQVSSSDFICFFQEYQAVLYLLCQCTSCLCRQFVQFAKTQRCIQQYSPGRFWLIFIRLFEGGWMYLFIYLFFGWSSRVRKSSWFATTLFHHAPLKVTSVLVVFVIFGGLFQLISIQVGFHKLRLAISVVFSIALISIAASCSQSMTRRQLTVGMSLRSYCLPFHFGRRERPCSRRRPTISLTLVDNNDYSFISAGAAECQL